jgi:hypothetical protein
MKQQNQSIVYASVDEAMRELRELIPMLQMAVNSPLPKPQDLDVGKMKKVLALLRDEDALRARLAKTALPDGRVQMCFTPEAWALLAEKDAL